MSIARNTKFGINVDFQKSHGLYLHDRTTNRQFLDFFGMYASLPLGYNHPIFKTPQFIDEYLIASSLKINNCEFVSDETLEFDQLFTDYAGVGIFKNIHYSCTGALAVEAAIKTCIQYKRFHEPKILSFHNSFHGINSYGAFVTSRFPGADRRLDGLPETFSIKIDPDLDLVEENLKRGDITCMLVEPIQCSAGDIHHSKSFFQELRRLCDLYDVPLVFDEIQIGFGGTGKLWFFQHLDIVPDIVIFGKKTQLSGIMVKDEFSQIFSSENSMRLEVTWDGDISDMIRCKFIMKAYRDYDILANVNRASEILSSRLSQIPEVLNLRNCGLIFGFDLTNEQFRDTIVNSLYGNGLICNKTGTRSIRLRPSLNLSEHDISQAVTIFEKTFSEKR